MAWLHTLPPSARPGVNEHHFIGLCKGQYGLWPRHYRAKCFYDSAILIFIYCSYTQAGSAVRSNVGSSLAMHCNLMLSLLPGF